MVTKVKGSLVGTKVAAAGFANVDSFLKDGTQKVLQRDLAALANTNVIGDQISLGIFKSNTLLDPRSYMWWDAAGAGVTVNIGDVNHANALGAAVSIAAAGNGALWAAFTPAKIGQPLWQVLGYASDPGGTIELLATIAGANVANAANVAWQILGTQR